MWSRFMWRIQNAKGVNLPTLQFTDIGRLILTDVYEGANRDICRNYKSVCKWSPIYSAFMINCNFHLEKNKKIFVFVDSEDHFNTKNLNASLLFMTKQQKENIKLVPIVASEDEVKKLSSYKLESVVEPFVGDVRSFTSPSLIDPIFMLGYTSAEVFLKKKISPLQPDNIRKDMVSIITGGTMNSDSLLLIDFITDDSTGKSFDMYFGTIATVNSYKVDILQKRMFPYKGPAKTNITNNPLYVIYEIIKLSKVGSINQLAATI